MKYTIQITFNTDRELTQDERDDIANAIALQVDEPQVRNTDETSLDFYVDADFTTTNTEVDYL